MANILLLHASAGSGHRSVACAVAEALSASENRLPTTVDVVDILSFGSPLFRLMYGKGYEFSAKYARWFVQGVFSLTDHPWDRSRLVDLSESLTAACVREVATFMKENGVRVACCTHFLPVALLCRMRRQGLYHGSIHVCVTDYDVHGFWYDPDVDLYHVASPQAVERLTGWGIDPSRVLLTGIPVRAGFAASAAPEMTAAEDENSSMRSRTLNILLIASSLRFAECRQILSELDEAHVPADVEIVTGRNQSLCEELKQAYGQREGLGTVRMRVRGFVNNVDQLMHASDLLITKPGGITVSEALTAGLPMLFVAPIPEHEVLNARILEGAGAGVACFDKGTLGRQVRWFALYPERLEQMRENCLRCARPDAAARIADQLLAAARMPAILCTRPHAFSQDHLTELTGAAGH